MSREVRSGRGGDADVEDVRMCDKCKKSQPVSETTVSREMNGWICKDSVRCEVRSAPQPRARAVQNFRDLARHGRNA